MANEIPLTDESAFLGQVSIFINSKVPFMLASENPNTSGALTAMDLLSTEAISRNSIGVFVDRLLNPKKMNGRPKSIFDPKGKGNTLNKKEIEAGKVRLINSTYEHAILFLQMLGVRLNKEQKERKFKSVDEFKEHVYRIKPELNEPELKDSRYVFKRKDGVGMIVECALVRAMDHVYDTLSSPRVQSLDKEAEAVLKKIKSIPGVHITNENESGFDIRYNHSEKYFEGHVYLRKKNFFKILLKMAYNRRYGEAEALKDLLGMRFETLNPGQENMANAVVFFQKEVFNKGAEYEQKGELLDENLIGKK